MPEIKKYIQYQKPMAAMLTALTLPLLAGIYNFGWRVLAVVSLSCAVCWIGEYIFTRKEGKPVSMAALVSAVLLALVLPPNIPFWMVIVGGIMAIVFGKMVFGGFGKNVFNPAMVGRCFLYVCFPLAMTSAWFAPVPGSAGGFAAWTTQEKVNEIESDVEGVSSATTLTAAKIINNRARATLDKSTDVDEYGALDEGAPIPANAKTEFDHLGQIFNSISLQKLFFGRISGSMGETSALMILLALGYLLYKKAVQWPLVVSPLVGLAGGTATLWALDIIVVPVDMAIATNFLGGGTLFACVFMTTEPVSAPMNKKARWIYGILIGIFAAVIRTMSVFNAGLMFSILLGNMFGPIIDHLCTEYDRKQKAKAKAKAAAAGEAGNG